MNDETKLWDTATTKTNKAGLPSFRVENTDNATTSSSYKEVVYKNSNDSLDFYNKTYYNNCYPNFDSFSVNYQQEEINKISRCSSNNYATNNYHTPFNLGFGTNASLQDDHKSNKSLSFIEKGYNSSTNQIFHSKTPQMNDFYLLQANSGSGFNYSGYEDYNYAHYDAS